MEPNVIPGALYELKEVPFGRPLATLHFLLPRAVVKDETGALDAKNLAVEKPLQLQAKFWYQSNID
jgi:hypothetical protein